MGSVPVLKPREVARLLERLGFVEARQRGGSNWGRMSDPKVDELADRALRESNKEKRRQAYWELQRYILTRGDTATVAVAWVEGWFFKDKRLQNYKPGLTTYDNNTFMKVWMSQ